MVFSHRRPPVFGGGPQRVRHQGNPDTAVNPKSIPQFEAPNTPLWIGNNDLQVGEFDEKRLKNVPPRA
jgi:hypothetical protein